MKILHIASFRLFDNGDRYYSTERKITNGFIRNGHTVYDYPYRNMAKYNNRLHTKSLGVKKMNKHLLEIVKNLKPELVVLGHAELVSADTLEQMKSINPLIKIIFWFVDAVYDQYRIDYIFKLQHLLDAAFITTNPKVIPDFEQNKFYYMPNVVDLSIDIHKNYEKTNFKYDFIFCGASKKSHDREDIMNTLNNKLNKTNLKFCGNMGEPNIFGNDYIELLGNSKMGLNYSKRNDVSMYSSDRIAQLTGNGILTFSPRIPDFEKVYTDEEIVYYDNENDLIEKIIFYNSNDDERRKVAKNGYFKSHTEYNSTKITNFMISTAFN